MRPDEIEEVRGALLVKQREILSNARDAEAFSRDRDRTRIGIDSIDQAATESLIGTTLVLAARDSEILSEVQIALKRLDTPEAGLCEDCEESIPFARLKARPTTKLCVPCQEDQE